MILPLAWNPCKAGVLTRMCLDLGWAIEFAGVLILRITFVLEWVDHIQSRNCRDKCPHEGTNGQNRTV
jgi:hypothetical protein